MRLNLNPVGSLPFRGGLVGLPLRLRLRLHNRVRDGRQLVDGTRLLLGILVAGDLDEVAPGERAALLEGTAGPVVQLGAVGQVAHVDALDGGRGCHALGQALGYEEPPQVSVPKTILN